ncbi:hypothetical protein BV898_06643 [Hypsibius exemplaris]|uniref:BHLH domain-containing protein n=1 Tax=Hypsibius exemplaris TaxID=2072580 RepID=A0A1W0WW74_HYPEX|nr:hypothetical protein BV898_06643 [Hypsibius exemplaris]
MTVGLSCVPKTANRLENLHNSSLFIRSRCARLMSASFSYKRLANREKPPHTVARRNARERRRVEAVNQAFSRLRKHVPAPSRGKRISKVKTLRLAIDYIAYLQNLLQWSTPPTTTMPDDHQQTNFGDGRRGQLPQLHAGSGGKTTDEGDNYIVRGVPMTHAFPSSSATIARYGVETGATNRVERVLEGWSTGLYGASKSDLNYVSPVVADSGSGYFGEFPSK